jgi:uncharacterized membrane protein
MASKTHVRRVRAARRRIAAAMRNAGLDPSSSADRLEWTRRLAERVRTNTLQNEAHR